MPTEI
jgi:hypothetical protein